MPSSRITVRVQMPCMYYKCSVIIVLSISVGGSYMCLSGCNSVGMLSPKCNPHALAGGPQEPHCVHCAVTTTLVRTLHSVKVRPTQSRLVEAHFHIFFNVVCKTTSLHICMPRKTMDIILTFSPDPICSCFFGHCSR